MKKPVINFVTWGFFALVTAVPVTAHSDPIKLKLAYFSSDQTTTYVGAIKPFVDAVNADPAGLLEISVSFSGQLGKDPAKQLQLVLDGTADLAFVVPGYTPDRFADNPVIELPGQFRNVREATLVYSRLIGAKALAGYEDVFVVGAFATEPETIHTRTRVSSLADLKGKRIRANNPIEAAALERLGMIAVQMPINKVSAAISGGEIDGAAVPPAPLVEFGISRVAANHYLLGVAAAPLTVLMNRKKFDGLPKAAQEVIRKFSGAWSAERYIATYEAENQKTIDQLKSDPKRNVVVPTTADRDRAAAAFRAEIDKWLAADPRHGVLLKKADAELATIRSNL
jgi:TRAP-type C4-dicarboxylate transport system substrate-binding protein